EARQRGAAAREYVASGWTWGRAVAIARERLASLFTPLPTPASPTPRLWCEPPPTAQGACPKGAQAPAPNRSERRKAKRAGARGKGQGRRANSGGRGERSVPTPNT